MKKGPIVFIDDDTDDQELYKQLFHSLALKNQLLIFNTGGEAYDYLATTTDHPFLILCDINLPYPDGFELRKRIQAHEGLLKKSIPFVFMSTSDFQEIVDKAFSMTVQGFFVKKQDYDEMLRDLKAICDYWRLCRHPCD